MTAARASGTIVALYRWPVKSMGGEAVAAAMLGPRGIAGDRAHALLHRRKGELARLTIRQAARMLLWRATYPDAPADRLAATIDPPPPTITAPDGSYGLWGDPTVARNIAADLGIEIRTHSDPLLMPDVDRTVLITTEQSRLAAATALKIDLDIRRFRPNIHLRWDDDTPAFAEQDWSGATVTIGALSASGVNMKLSQACVRCVIPTRDPDSTQRNPTILKWLAANHETKFGIYAQPGPIGGRIAVGDRVTVHSPTA